MGTIFHAARTERRAAEQAVEPDGPLRGPQVNGTALGATVRKSIFEVISVVALAIGLLLVAYELKQTRMLSESQLIHDYYSLVSSSRNAFWEDKTLEAVAASCAGENLDIQDGIVLEAYFTELLSHVSRQVRMQKMGFDLNPQYTAIVQFDRVFSHEAGIRYWRAFRHEYNEQIRRYGDEILEAGNFESCSLRTAKIVEDTGT